MMQFKTWFEQFITDREWTESSVPQHEEEIRDANHIYELLKQYSIAEGGAWAWHVLPFSKTCRFFRYASPSKVPYDMMDWMRTDEFPNGAIGYKGKIVPFSKAQIIRDQQRGYGKD